jgi:hypothetical protein
MSNETTFGDHLVLQAAAEAILNKHLGYFDCVMLVDVILITVTLVVTVAKTERSTQ